MPSSVRHFAILSAVLGALVAAPAAQASLIGPVLGTVGDVVSPATGDALAQTGSTLDAAIDPVTGAVDPLLAPTLEPTQPVLDTLLGADTVGAITGTDGGTTVLTTDQVSTVTTTLENLLSVSGLPTNDTDLAVLAALVSSLQQTVDSLPVNAPLSTLQLLSKAVSALNGLIGGASSLTDLLGLDGQVAALIGALNPKLAAAGLPTITVLKQGSTPAGGPGTQARHDSRAGRVYLVSKKITLKGKVAKLKLKCKATTSGCRGSVGGKRVKLRAGSRKVTTLKLSKANAKRALKARSIRLLVVSDGVDVAIKTIKIAKPHKHSQRR